MVTTFYPPHVGGIEYHVENLSKELTNKGHKITILTTELSPKNPPSIEQTSANLDVVKLKAFFPLRHIYPSLSSQGFTLNTKTTIEKIVKEKKIDVIHVHGHHYYLSWRAIAIAHALRAPSVLTIHGLFALNPESFIARVIEKTFNYIIFRKELLTVNALIGLTPRITNYAKKYNPAVKNYNIPNGVNYELFNSNLKNKFVYRKKYRIPPDKTVILFRGRFASIKGVLELVEAAKLLLKTNKQLYFVFVGDGPLKIKIITSLHPMQQYCRILGWSPINELHELYIASDIFVLPSKSEALPLTILEAMAANLHIITTPVGGIPDVLEKYPRKCYIDDLSAKGLSMLLLKYINQSISVQNEQSTVTFKHLQPFNWLKIASEVEKVYQHIAV